MRKLYIAILVLSIVAATTIGFAVYFCNGIFIGQPMITSKYFLNGIFIGQPMMTQRVFPAMLIPGGWGAFGPYC